ncbi:MAG TPA: delta-60 repeat domain-containing protein [Candidatus Sulfotelmatobacter sp.]
MKKTTFHMITGLLAVVLVFGINRAHAQAGSLDTTFGKGGTVTANLGVTATTLTAIEQSNGDIAVVTGLNKTGFPNVETFALIRYTSTGTRLSTTTASFFTNGINAPAAVAVQSNGDIVVAGTASSGIDQSGEFALARFLPTGKLDTTFGQGGLVTTLPTGGFPTVSALLVQPNGQILIAGSADSGLKKVQSPTILVRYNSNGSLDPAFGAGGIVEEPTPVLAPSAMAQLSDGSYLVAAGASSAQFSSTGVLQSTVTPEPIVASNPSSPFSEAIVFQPNGDFVEAAIVGNGFQKTAGELFRFSETAVVDSTFLSTKFTFGEQKQNQPAAIALQSNGQFVVGGGCGLARVDSDGVLDTAFGTGGSLATTFGISGVLIQTDGNIVVVGGHENSQTGVTTLSVQRYLGN